MVKKNNFANIPIDRYNELIDIEKNLKKYKEDCKKKYDKYKEECDNNCEEFKEKYKKKYEEAILNGELVDLTEELLEESICRNSRRLACSSRDKMLQELIKFIGLDDLEIDHSWHEKKITINGISYFADDDYIQKEIDKKILISDCETLKKQKEEYEAILKSYIDSKTIINDSKKENKTILEKLKGIMNKLNK